MEVSSEGFSLRAFLRAQRSISGCLAPGASIDEAGPSLLDHVCRLFGWDAAVLWRVGVESSALNCVCWHDSPAGAGSLGDVCSGQTFERGEGLPGRAWAIGEITWARASDDSVDDPRQSALDDLGYQSSIAVPVPPGSPDSVLAVVEFFHSGAVERSGEAEEVLLSFASQLDGFLRAGEAEPEVERVRQHMSEVVRGSQDAVLSKDLNGTITSWNPAAERMYGHPAEEAIGRHISFIIPSDHKDEEKAILDRVCRGERLNTYETERIRADGTRIAVSLTVSPIKTAAHELIGASVIARDITAEKRARGAEAFLVAASRRLDASLDPTETARTIVGTAVPELAEICVIDFLRPDGWLGDSIVAGADPEIARRLEEIRARSPLDPEGEHPVAQVLRAGMPLSWRDLKAPEVVDTVAQNEDHRRLMDEAGYHSAAAVPLVARGRTLGILSFLHATADVRFDSEDLAFLSELGDRAALALDNAMLYEERDRIAQDLQRGLRPPSPPEVPGLEVSVVFEAAGEGSEIGGDFYDVIPTEDGCWLLIGDVAGKGSAAAGVSVAVRHAVRGLCREIDDPAEILGRVNELLCEGDSLNDFATTDLIRMRRQGGGWELSMAAAGHPPAIHLSGDEARQLGGGALLGAWPEPKIERHDTTLEEGETLILSTDGWFEVGRVADHRPPDALAEMSSSLASLELPEMTDRLRADAVERASGILKDDMVILACRPR